MFYEGNAFSCYSYSTLRPSVETYLHIYRECNYITKNLKNIIINSSKHHIEPNMTTKAFILLPRVKKMYLGLQIVPSKRKTDSRRRDPSDWESSLPTSDP